MYNVLAAWVVLGLLITLLGPWGVAWISWVGVVTALGSTLGLGAYATYSLYALAKAHQREQARAAELESRYQDLQESLTQAQSSLRIKDTFFVCVSHQVRTSLTAILGYTELLLDDGMDYPQLLPDLDRIYMASTQLSTLMGEVFELTRYDAQVPTPEPTEFLVKGLTDELSVVFMKLCKLRGNQLKVELEVDLLNIDRQLLGKLLASMLTVSNNATDNGEIVLRLHAPPSGQRLIVEVQDNGKALRKEQLEVMAPLNLLAKQDVNKLSKQMLAGLPLMLATRLCKSLGGQFEVSAVAGEGNRLSVTLPLSPQA